MPEEKESRVMLDLQDGKDYLVNYYEFFGVSRVALEGTDAHAAEALLKSAYREKNMQYHPDRYAHLSPLMQKQAEQVHRSVEWGYRTLTDPAKREAYNKQLAEWKGPISENGFAIYDWGFQAGLNRRAMTDHEIAKAKVLLSDIAGYNPNTHKLLERLAEEKSSDPEIRDALDGSLESQEIFVGIEEHLRWQQAGVADPAIPEATVGYLDRVKEEVERLKAKIPQQAAQFLLEAQSGQLKLTAVTGEDCTQDAVLKPQEALAQITKALLKPIEDAAPKLEALAKQREEIFARRLELSIEYRPLQKKFRPNLAVCIRSSHSELVFWFACKLEDGTRVVHDESLTKEQLCVLEDPKQARAWIKRGWSIMVLTGRHCLDVGAQYQAAVIQHFENYSKQEKLKAE